MKKTKAGYVDGYVLVVQKKRVAAYRQMAREAGKIWRKYGCLDFKECIGDDMKTKHGLPFPRMVKLKRDETVFFSYIVYKSRAHRDMVNDKVMKDPFMDNPKYKDMPMPFDMKRMAYGGFKILVSA